MEKVPSDLLTDEVFLNISRACAPYSLTTGERMYALYQAIRFLAESGIDGDIVECGVWRGGSSMLAAMTLRAIGDETRTLWLYDTFEGMTEPGPEDLDLHGHPARDQLDQMRESGQRWDYSPLDEVVTNMRSTCYSEGRVRFVPGPVEETIPAVTPSRIALLRLDTDWFASTYHEMRHLYPLLVPGGVLIVDDYGHWEGARAAVHRYLSEQGIVLLLHRIDYTGRIAIKPFDAAAGAGGAQLERISQEDTNKGTRKDKKEKKNKKKVKKNNID